MPPNISSRAFIQWPPAPRSEPTSTLVLTSSQRQFVDIRILQNKAPDTEAAIDWAFAGRSASSSVGGKVLSQWHHWVDSTSLKPEDVIDKGEMLPGDADGVALEKGEMVNPGTGLVAEYIEGWRDVEAGSVPGVGQDFAERFLKQLESRGVRVKGLQSGEESAQLVRSNARVSVVLQHEDEPRRSRGMAVRLGHLCQAVVRVGDDFALERWEWSLRSGWQRTARSGTLPMPCDVMNMLGDIMSTETTVTYTNGDESMWKCVEVERF